MTIEIPPQLSAIVRQRAGLLVIDKPAGISTHRPSPEIPGLAEYLEEALGAAPRVCHRLDKETSGALVMALDAESASAACRAFEEHAVEKEYLFVTDRPPGPKSELERRSFIRKYRGRFVSWSKKAESNAETRFVLASRHGRFSLWNAYPRTGKPHQIRLHAHDLGIPVLGDRVHGGSRFVRLMLHARRIGFPWRDGIFEHISEPSGLFLDPSLCGDLSVAEKIIAGELAALPESLGRLLGVPDK